MCYLKNCQLFRSYSNSVEQMKEYGALVKYTDRNNQSTQRKTYHSVTSPTTSPPWTGLRLNLVLHGARMVTNCLSHDTAIFLTLYGSCIVINLHNKNQQDALSFQIYSNKYPLYVSNRLTFHPQEAVYCTCSL